MTETYPLAPVVKREPNPSHPGYVLLSVACPYCGRLHHHGGSEKDTDHGHRASHCARSNGYLVVEGARSAERTR